MKEQKTLLLYFIVAVLVFFTVSCKKDKLQHTTAEGVVVDITTQQPVSGALVQLLTQKRQILSYGGYTVVDSTRTDAEGKFYFSFQADDDFIYDLQAKAKRYIEQGDLTGVTNGKKNNKTLTLQPEAFLKLIIRNSIAANNKSISINEFAFNQQTYFNGGSGDTEVLLIVPGNNSNVIHWWVYASGEGLSYNKNIYCQAHDTTTYTIEY
jgi:hypothetical protein